MRRRPQYFNPMILSSNFILNYITVGHRLKCGKTNKIEMIIFILPQIEVLKLWCDFLTSDNAQETWENALSWNTRMYLQPQILHHKAHEWFGIFLQLYNVIRKFKW